MKTRWTALLVPVFLLAGLTASADDGEKVLKRMSHNAKVTVTPEEVGVPVSESEHAFIDMMKFYVPSQAASGMPLQVDYLNADGGLVETLPVAKPLVSVFIHGPAIGVEGTPFAHSFMDAFAAVSLDDGVTWKPTNLSESADQSSFRLGLNVTLASHDDEDEDDGDDHHAAVGPIIDKAKWEDDKGGTLEVEGDDVDGKVTVSIINALTKEVVATTKADKEGEWEVEESRIGAAPCVIAAVVDGVQGPGVVPEDTPEDCDGGYIVDYPGGVHNIFHATVGNKVLVAWPSRYCDQGKPAYALQNDEEQLAKIVEFIQTGQTADEYPAPALGSFSLEDDLYLVDAFGVAGSQNQTFSLMRLIMCA